jgi:hypothetical protein
MAPVVGAAVWRAGGEALFGRSLRQQMWRSPQRVVHDFTDSSPSGGIRPLQRLIGHGRRWRRVVDGAAGMQEVTVDADAAWGKLFVVLEGCCSWWITVIAVSQRVAVSVRVSVLAAVWRMALRWRC